MGSGKSRRRATGIRSAVPLPSSQRLLRALALASVVGVGAVSGLGAFGMGPFSALAGDTRQAPPQEVEELPAGSGPSDGGGEQPVPAEAIPEEDSPSATPSAEETEAAEETVSPDPSEPAAEDADAEDSADEEQPPAPAERRGGGGERGNGGGSSGGSNGGGGGSWTPPATSTPEAPTAPDGSGTTPPETTDPVGPSDPSDPPETTDPADPPDPSDPPETSEPVDPPTEDEVGDGDHGGTEAPGGTPSEHPTSGATADTPP